MAKVKVDADRLTKIEQLLAAIAKHLKVVLPTEKKPGVSSVAKRPRRKLNVKF